MSQITVEKTAEDSASKSLRVTVPVDRVREAEARALQVLCQAGPAAGLPPGQSPGHRGAQAVRRRHPADGAGGGHPGELGDRQDRRVAQAHHRSLHPQSEVRGRQPDRVRAPGRGASRAQAGAGGRVPARAAGSQPVTDARWTSSSPGCRSRRPPGSRSKGSKPAPGQMVRVEVAPHRERSRRPGPAARPGAGENQAIPELEERIMALLPGRDHRDRGPLSRRSPGRVPAGPDPPGAGDPARGQAAGAADPGRRPRPRGRRLREPRRPSGPPSARTWSARPPGRPMPRSGRQLLAQIVEANQVEAPDSLVHRLMHGYAEMYKVPQEQLAQLRAAVPPDRGDPGAAGTWCWTRWWKPTGSAPPRPSSTRGSTHGRGAGRARRPSCTLRSRRPTGWGSWSVPSPRRRRSTSSSRSPPSKRSSS